MSTKYVCSSSEKVNGFSIDVTNVHYMPSELNIHLGNATLRVEFDAQNRERIAVILRDVSKTMLQCSWQGYTSEHATYPASSANSLPSEGDVFVRSTKLLKDKEEFKCESLKSNRVHRKCSQRFRVVLGGILGPKVVPNIPCLTLTCSSFSSQTPESLTTRNRFSKQRVLRMVTPKTCVVWMRCLPRLSNTASSIRYASRVRYIRAVSQSQVKPAPPQYEGGIGPSGREE